MASELSAPPVLSTPDNHILSEIEPATTTEPSQHLSDEEVTIRYEIDRTVREIKRNKWRRIALQFPDQMLPDSVRVYQLLARGFKAESVAMRSDSTEHVDVSPHDQVAALEVSEVEKPVKLTILGDTSYGSCCVDEIAAEHVDADAVVHYGRSCLSPTARLPVIHVFTTRELDHQAVCEAFPSAFAERDVKVVVTADTPYADHVVAIVGRLQAMGYSNLFAAEILHDPSSVIPNRTVPDSITENAEELNEWNLFHVSDPPTSLLLTLSSRMKSVHIYPTIAENGTTPLPQKADSSRVLRRRYALITSLGTVSTWGILINTLSVKNYLHIVEHVRNSILAAGKKSYLFVVGKLNAAKVANFAEIGGWVVIGCWESSLVDSKDFYKPIITPFELDMVLAGDDNRIWTGEWRSDFQGVLDRPPNPQPEVEEEPEPKMPGAFIEDEDNEELRDLDSDEESAPPEFDLRTGRYVSHSRPMESRMPIRGMRDGGPSRASSTAMIKRLNGELLAVKGVASPAAEFLAQKRTWQGLGSDFEIKYEDEEEEGGLIEEGRTGVARGYTVADSTRS